MPVWWKIKREYACFQQPLPHHMESALIQTQALLQSLTLDLGEAASTKLIPTRPPLDTPVIATVAPPSAAGLYRRFGE